MKKFFLLGLLFACANAPVFAGKDCLTNIDSHVDRGGQRLSLKACGLTAKDMPKVIGFLKEHSAISNVNLDYNNIGSEGAKILAQNDSLLENGMLHLTSNHIDTEGAIALASSKISWLLLADNHIESEGIIKLAQDKHLAFLDISFNNLDKASIAALANAKFGLCFGGANRLSTADIELIAHQKVRLDIVNEPIGDEGAKVLAKSKTLDVLFLINNKITPAGFKAFADNTSLEVLETYNNYVGTEGAEALAKNTSIWLLEIVNGNVGDEGAAKFADNKKLAGLKIAKDSISDTGAEALARGQFQNLYLPANNIGTQGALALAKNAKLSALDLSENFGIGEPAINALMNSKSLRVVGFRDTFSFGEMININDDEVKFTKTFDLFQDLKRN